MGYYFKYNGINYALHFTSYISVDYTDYYIGSDDQAWYEAIPGAIATLYGFNVVNTNYKYGNDARTIYAYERNVINKLKFSYTSDVYEEGSRLTQILCNYNFKTGTTYEIKIYKTINPASQTGTSVYSKTGTVNSGKTINVTGCPVLQCASYGEGDNYYYIIKIKFSNSDQGVYNLEILGYWANYNLDSQNNMWCEFNKLSTARQVKNNQTQQLRDGSGTAITTYYFYPYTDGTNYWSLT